MAQARLQGLSLRSSASYNFIPIFVPTKGVWAGITDSWALPFSLATCFHLPLPWAFFPFFAPTLSKFLISFSLGLDLLLRGLLISYVFFVGYFAWPTLKKAPSFFLNKSLTRSELVSFCPSRASFLFLESCISFSLLSYPNRFSTNEGFDISKSSKPRL